MKKKELILGYDSSQFPRLIENADKSPIYVYYDESGTTNAAMYRIFSVGDEEAPDARCQAWLSAREQDSMTPEIAAYEIASFQAPAPYSLSLSFLTKEQIYVREGDSGNRIEFTFQTVDSAGVRLAESVQVMYSFNNAGTVQGTTKIFNTGEVASINIDKFLSVGLNTVTVTVTGRSTGASTIRVIRYYVVDMNLYSSFNVAVPQSRGEYLSVPYSLRSSSAGIKYIEFYVDGTLAKTETVTETVADSSVTLEMPETPGKHHLQIRAYVEAGDGNFFSKTLYREFVVTGKSGYEIMLSADLDSGTLITQDKTNLFITAEQYIQSNVTWGYYSSTGAGATVRWLLGGTSLRSTEAQVTDAESNAKPYTLSYVPVETGTLELTARIGDVDTVYSVLVKINSSGISEATNGLALKLLSLGRSNSEPSDERNVWEWEGVRAEFPSDFAWSEQQGWQTDEKNQSSLAVSGGKQVRIPYKPFANAPHTYGMVFEIEFKTYDVDDEDDVVCEVWGVNSDGHECGVKIYAEGALMQSADNITMRTKFKQNERIKLAFVVNRVGSATFPHMAFIMADGCYERAVDYGEGGSYTNNADIVLGSASGRSSIKVYSVRCYRQAITVQQEMYNAWIDSGNIGTKVQDNDIYANGIVSPEKMQGVIPVMLIDGIDVAYNNIPTLEGVQDKDTKINVNVSFFNPNDQTKNFSIQGARMKLQGTSSLGYPRKNFKLYSSKDGAVMKDFEGNVIKKGLYAWKDGEVPVDVWTLKADFMDSSCTRNKSIACLYGDIEPNLNIKDAEGNDALKTPPQLAAQRYVQETGVEFPYNLRTTVNGHSIVIFHRLPGDKQYTFLGQYNMLNDKSNEYVFGFHSIYAPTEQGVSNGYGEVVTSDPMCILKSYDKKELLKSGDVKMLYDNSTCHCYEILDNTSGYSNFDSAEGWNELIPVEGSIYKHYKIESAFESRYPELDDDEEYESQEARNAAVEKEFGPLVEFITWMSSVMSGGEVDTLKFDMECEEHLNLHFLAAYYTYILRFGAVDQVKKNMMWTTYDGVHWFAIRYDNDTTIDKKNSGALFYSYTFDRQTIDTTTSGEYCYAGHDSALWNALEGNGRFMSLVKLVDNAFYAAGLTYETVLSYFDSATRDLWCESIYNENMHYKYISPLIRSSNKQDWLQFLQGTDKNHSHWWLRNRFDMYDAKWGTGEWANKSVRLIAGGTPEGAKMYLEAARHSSFGWGINKVVRPVDDAGNYSIEVDKGAAFELTVNKGGGLAIGDPVYIFGANNLQKIDLHELAPYLSSAIELANMYDKELGSQLKTLILGVSDSDLAAGIVNKASDLSFSGFDVLSRLEYLDVKGLSNVVSLPFMTSLKSLKTLLAAGTAITSFTCADGITFDKLQLPETLRSMNLSRVAWKALDYEPLSTLKSLNLDYMTDETSFGGVRDFVWSWLDMLEATYGMTERWSDFTLNLTGVRWTNVSWHRIEQLLNVGTCNMTGHSYIKCDTEYTSKQMSEMMNRWGRNIFTAGNDLVMDCDATKVVISASGDKTTICDDGVVEVLQGTECQLKAVGFPVLVSDEAYKWYVRLDDKLNAGNEQFPTLAFDHSTLHYRSGVLQTTECADDDKEYEIYCENTETLVNGSITVRVKKRTYPNEAEVRYTMGTAETEIDSVTGVMQIISRGHYLFDAIHRRTVDGVETEYSGTRTEADGGEWEIYGSDESYMSKCVQDYLNGKTGFDEYCMQISSLPDDDLNIEVRYKSRWKNGLVLTATPLKVCVVSVIYNMLTASGVTGNPALYTMFDAMGIGHKAAAAYTSQELKAVSGELHVAPLLEAAGLSANDLKSTWSEGYDVLNALKNVTGLDFSGCGNLEGKVNLGIMKWLRTAKMTGCVKVTEVTLPAGVTELSADAMDGLGIEAEVASVAEDVLQLTDGRMGDTEASLFVKDELVPMYVEQYGADVRRFVEPMSDYGKTGLMFADGSRVRWGNDDGAIIG